MKKLTLLTATILSVLFLLNPLYAGRYYIPEIGRFATPDPALQKMHPNELVEFKGGALLRTSPYVYANNNPLRYIDPDGNTFWDVLDVVSVGLSAKDFYQKPTWANAGWLAADVVALLPIVPSTGLVRHGSRLASKADIIKFNFKAGKAAEQFVGTALKASGETFSKQVTRGASRLDFVTDAGKVIEVKNINWSANTYQKGGGVTGRVNTIRNQLLKYQGTLKDGEQLVLKITKPDNAKALEQLQNMTREIGASIEWLK